MSAGKVSVDLIVHWTIRGGDTSRERAKRMNFLQWVHSTMLYEIGLRQALNLIYRDMHCLRM
jgi:hypothetical protein